MNTTAVKLTKTPQQEITGIFYKADDLYQHPTSTFQKRTFYLQFDDSYEYNGEQVKKDNFIPFDAVGDKAIATVGTLSQGDEVKVVYRQEGRKWRKDENSPVKIFMNNKAFGVERIETPTVIQQHPKGGGSANQLDVTQIEDDDLPF